MTTRILLVAHAPLASAFKEVAAHVAPDAVRRLEVFDVRSDERFEDVEARLARILGDDDALLLCDVPGATPCNVACRLARSRTSLRVVAGLNVPMVWRVLWSADRPLGELARLAGERAVRGVDPEPGGAGDE
jgi:PTS system ascorbate-specific IIA component